MLLDAPDIGPGLIAATGPAPAPAVGPDDLALLPYSSGTSGLPKGVMVTHANLVTAVRQVSRGLRLTPDDVVVALAPFSHVMGFVITLGSALAAGARAVTVPRFEADELPRRCSEHHRVTVVIVPPPVMRVLAYHPAVDALDLSAIELIVCGGAPLGADLQRAVARAVPARRGRPGLGPDRVDGLRHDARPRARHRAGLRGAADAEHASCAWSTASC